MKAIEFNEQNVKIAENQEEYLTLPAHVTENGDVYCCMELNEKDIEMIKKNGKIWLNFKTFGKSLQPFNLSFSESIFKDGSMWAFETEEEKPKEYKFIGKRSENLIFPRQNQKDLRDKIKSLPVVTFQDLNDCIGFKTQTKTMSGGRFKKHNTFGLFNKDDFFVIEISKDCDYTPKEDMVELLSSEFKNLTKD